MAGQVYLYNPVAIIRACDTRFRLKVDREFDVLYAIGQHISNANTKYHTRESIIHSQPACKLSSVKQTMSLYTGSAINHKFQEQADPWQAVSVCFCGRSWFRRRHVLRTHPDNHARIYQTGWWPDPAKKMFTAFTSDHLKSIPKFVIATRAWRAE